MASLSKVAEECKLSYEEQSDDPIDSVTESVDLDCLINLNSAEEEELKLRGLGWLAGKRERRVINGRTI